MRRTSSKSQYGPERQHAEGGRGHYFHHASHDDGDEYHDPVWWFGNNQIIAGNDTGVLTAFVSYVVQISYPDDGFHDNPEQLQVPASARRINEIFMEIV